MLYVLQTTEAGLKTIKTTSFLNYMTIWSLHGAYDGLLIMF